MRQETKGYIVVVAEGGKGDSWMQTMKATQQAFNLLIGRISKTNWWLVMLVRIETSGYQRLLEYSA